VVRLDKRKPKLIVATEADHREAWVNFQTFGWSVLQAGEGGHMPEREVAAGGERRPKTTAATEANQREAWVNFQTFGRSGQ
jgi:hypothetical protein